MLRRLKSDVMKDLPKKREVVIFCPFTPLQKDFYSVLLVKRDLHMWMGSTKDANRKSMGSLLQNMLMQLRKVRSLLTSAYNRGLQSPFLAWRLIWQLSRKTPKSNRRRKERRWYRAWRRGGRRSESRRASKDRRYHLSSVCLKLSGFEERGSKLRKLKRVEYREDSIEEMSDKKVCQKILVWHA